MSLVGGRACLRVSGCLKCFLVAVLHEAVCRAEPDLVRLILEYKDAQKQSKRSSMVPDLLRRLADAPDFYVEIKFELASWSKFLGKEGKEIFF